MRTFITLIIVLLVTVVPVMAQSAADEAAVREATKKYFAAHNKHDVKAVAALLDENYQSWTDTGKAAAMKSLEERFKTMKDAQFKFAEEIGVDFLAPDIAVHKFYITWSGFLDTDGKTSPPGRSLWAPLYVKKNGQWLRRTLFWRIEEE